MNSNDLISDPLLPLSKACKLVPGGHGKPCSTSSRLLRWINRGHNGVRLAAMRTPDGTWLVRPSQLLEFLAAIAGQSPVVAEQPKTSAWAEAVLARPWRK